jgi:hypothetical protein
VKLYVGLKENVKPIIFESKKGPNKETYPQFDIIFGQLKSREDTEKYDAAMDLVVTCCEG